MERRRDGETRLKQSLCLSVPPSLGPSICRSLLPFVNVPMRFTARGILLDIEGTTSSVSFVYDVMFPYVRKHLTFEVFANWMEPEYIEAFHAIARDAGRDSLDGWLKSQGLTRDN